MDSASLPMTWSVRASLACVGFLLSLTTQTADATVTWDGSGGVNQQVFQAYCTSCHSAGGSPSQLPYFTSYSTASTNIVTIIDRINLATGNILLMPPTTHGGPLNSDYLSLMNQWHAHEAPQHAAPSVTTDAASAIVKVQASLNGAVNANGLTTDYWFQWGLDDGGSNFPNSTAQQATADTNGGLTAQLVSAVQGSLTCGTDYQYRAVAENSDGPTTGLAVYFTTGDCDDPVVAFGGSQVAGVGESITIPLALEGDGSTDYRYPVTIQYEITGTANAGDIVLSSSDVSINSTAKTITINSGQGGDLSLQILGNAEAPKNASIILSLASVTTGNATLPDPSEFTVVITGDGAEPFIPMQVTQADTQGRHSQYIYKDLGDVTVTVDPGTGGTPVYDWSGTDSRLLGADTVIDANQLTFDATDAAVVPGAYLVVVTITNGQTQTHQSITLWVETSAPVLGCGVDDDANGNDICDETEGFGDFDGDGLPDYLDPTGDPTVLNKTVTGDAADIVRTITTTAGLSLALGDAAIEAVGGGHTTGARIPAHILSNDPGYSVMSGVYDFQIRGLTDVQRAVKVVIPLERPMPSNAVYRKLNGSVWADFVEIAADEIRSAASVNYECPPPGSTAYAAGLVAFNDCVELTLTDGGPNDADGEANGVIRDPGAVVVAATADDTAPAPVPTSAPGGAGTLEWWWLTLVPALLWRRRGSSIGKQE